MGAGSDGEQYLADVPKGYSRVPYDDITLFVKVKDYADEIDEDKSNMAQYASKSFVEDSNKAAGDQYTSVVFEKDNNGLA